MSVGNWRSSNKGGRRLPGAAFAVVLNLLGVVPAATDLAAQSKGAAKSEQPSAQEDVTKNMTLAPRAQRQRTNPKVYLADCTQPKDHDQADLCEQIRMADAAKSAERIAYKQYVVSIIGLVALVFRHKHVNPKLVRI